MEKEGKCKTERTIKERKTSSGCCLAFKKYHHFWGFAKHEFLLKASLAKTSTFYINRDF